MQGKIKCSKCNNMIAIGTVFCPFCGSEQAPSASAAESVTSRRRKGAHNVPIVKAGESVMVPVKVKEVAVPKNEESKMVDSVVEESLSGAASSTQSIPVEQSEPATSDSIGAAENPTVAADIEASEEVKVSEASDQTPEPVSIDETQEIIDKIASEEQNAAEKVDEATAAEENSDDEKKKNRFKERRNQKNVEYELYHDELTCCLNRKAYEKRLGEVSSDLYCVIVADANNLKKINDSLGHANGDILLASIAQALQAVFGNDNCYRTGGDEFAVILEGIEEETVKERIERFRVDLKGRERKQRENGAQIDMKAAVGYAYGQKPSEIKNVCEKADESMYEDKHKIKQIYDPNYDGYYNDVRVQYEELKVDIDRDNLHKAALVIIALVIFLIFYFVFIF